MKTIKDILVCTALLAGLVSCSLEETPEHFVDSSRFYNTEAQCRAALNSCYDDLNGIFNYKMFFMTEIQSDLWYNTSGTDYNATLDITPSSPGHGATVWTNCYGAIMICNECVECIGASPLADEVKAPMVAEAKVLRAMYYHILMQVFNGVPFYTNRVATLEDMEKIRTLPRTPADEIRDALYEDLEEALKSFNESNGLDRRTCELAVPRAGYALGLYLMASFALWNEKYEAALIPLKKLEDIYGELSEENYPLRETMWSIANTPESIFEIQHAWSVSGVQYYGNLARVMTPTWSAGADDVSLYGGLSLANGFHYSNEKGDLISFPKFEDRMSTTTVSRCSKHLAMMTYAISEKNGEFSFASGSKAKQSLLWPLPLKPDSMWVQVNQKGEPILDDKGKKQYDYRLALDLDYVKEMRVEGKPIDRRVFYLLGLGNYQTGETFDVVAKHDRPYAGPKFWCPTMIQGYDSNNYKLYRYADAVLMMAECYAGLDKTDEALKYLNKTRIRAGVDPIEAPDDLLQEIKDERARELAGEMHRKFDLVRWGDWFTAVDEYQEKGTILNNMRECHRYYPIPDTECALSGYVLKNEEY